MLPTLLFSISFPSLLFYADYPLTLTFLSLQTNLPTFPAPLYGSSTGPRGISSGCTLPSRRRVLSCIVPSLHPPILLDATISEFQRFLSRVSSHKALSTHHYFVVFISGTEVSILVHTDWDILKCPEYKG